MGSIPTLTQLYSLVLKSLANAKACGARLLSGWQRVADLLVITELDFRKADCFTHAEGILEFGGRAGHIIVCRMADICNLLFAVCLLSRMCYNTHLCLVKVY